MTPKHLLTSFLILLVLFAGCEIKEPVLPSWEVLVRVPFLVDSLIMGEEIVDSTNFVVKPDSVDPDRVLLLNIPGDFQIAEVSGDDFQIDATTLSSEVTVGNLTLNSVEPIDYQLSINDIVDLSGSVGQTITIPDQSVNSPSLETSSDYFESVHVLSGTVSLTITNNLPFPIGPNGLNSALNVQIFSDDNDVDPFAALDFGDTIFPGSTVTASSDVNNRWLVNPVGAELLIPIISETVDVTQEMLDTSSVLISLTLSDVQASEAVVRLEEQQFSENTGWPISGSIRLKSGEIASGGIDISVENNLPIDAQTTITLPQVLPDGSNQWQSEVTIPSGSTWSHSIDLTGAQIINPDNPDAFIDTILVGIDATTESQSDLVTITSEDGFAVDIAMQTLSFQSFNGFIESQTFTMAPLRQHNVADYGGFDGTVELNAAILQLDITNHLNVDNLELDLTVIGYHENESGVATDSAVVALNNIVFGNAKGGQPVTTEILIEDGLIDFLHILPTDILFSGEVRVSGNANVSQGDQILTDYLFETPFSVQVLSDSRLQADEDVIEAEDINEEIADAADEHLLEATLSLQLTNRTPFAGTLYLYISADAADTNIYIHDVGDDTSLVIHESISIVGGSTDPQTGFVTQPWGSTIDLSLSQREIQLFNDPPLRIGFELEIPQTNGFVTLRYSDFVNIIGEANIRVLVKDD